MEDFNAAQEELLNRYKKGICTPQEKAVVENWYNQQSEMTSDDLDEPDYDQTRNEIWTALQSRRIKALNENKDKTVTGLKRRYLSIAASFLIVVAAGLFFLMYKK